MIQRIQSIFLFLVVVSMVVMLFFPVWNKDDVEKSEIARVTTFKFTHVKVNIKNGEEAILSEKPTFVISIFVVLATVVAIYSAFRYDNRLLQMKLGALNSLVIGLGVIGTSTYYIFEAEKVIAPQLQGAYLFAFYVAVSAMFFNFLANRFIRKDEKLIKSADRIR